ncbi:MAG: polysaccharide biosynthesis tyrosine autokinase [Thermogutta sp.]
MSQHERLPEPSSGVPIGVSPWFATGQTSPQFVDAEWHPLDETEGTQQGLGAYLHAFRRRWFPAVFLGVFFAAVAAVAVWFLYVPRYTATAMIRIASSTQTVLFPTNDRGGTSFDIYKATQLEYLRSRFVLVAALRQPEVARLPSIQEQLDPVQWVSENLSVRFPGNSEFMNVSFSSRRPAETAVLVNAIVDAYMREVVDTEQRERRERLSELDQLYAEKESELRKLENDLKTLSQQLETGDSQALSLKQQIILQQFSTYRSELINVQLRIMRTQGELSLKKALRDKAAQLQVTERELDAAARTDPLLLQLSIREAELKKLIAQARDVVRPEMANRYGNRFNQDLIDVQNRIQARREELRQELEQKRVVNIDEEIENLNFELAILDQQQKQLEQEVEKIRQIAETFGKGSIEIEFLRAEVDLARKTLQTIAEERNRMSIELRAKPRITVVQRAETPRVADQDKRIQLATLAGLAGLILPGAVLLWWDVRRKPINAPQDVLRAGGVDVWGTIPLLPPRAMRAITDERVRSKKHRQWRQMFIESVRKIAARLIRESDDNRLKVVMVTSAIAGEGKTTLAGQLALSLAQMGKKTIIVDFDLRRPAIHDAFNIRISPGLSEVLRGEISLNDAIQAASIENLYVLSAGYWSPHRLAVLANGVVGTIFNQLREEFDLVIVDGTPVLPVADTRFISTHCDGVVLSVIRDYSRGPLVRSTKQILESFRVRVLGTVMTGSASDAYYHTRSYRGLLGDAQGPTDDVEDVETETTQS